MFHCEENKPITQLYFSQKKWERKWKWLEFSLSWKTLQWFTPTTEANAMNINTQEQLLKNNQSTLAPYRRKTFEMRDILCVYLDNQIYYQSSV